MSTSNINSGNGANWSQLDFSSLGLQDLAYEILRSRRGLIGPLANWTVTKALPFTFKASVIFFSIYGPSLMNGVITSSQMNLLRASWNSIYNNDSNYLREQLRPLTFIRNSVRGGVAGAVGDHLQQLAGSSEMARDALNFSSNAITLNILSIIEDRGVVVTYTEEPQPWTVESGKIYVYIKDGQISFKVDTFVGQLSDEELGEAGPQIREVLNSGNRELTNQQLELIILILAAKGHPPVSLFRGVPQAAAAGASSNLFQRLFRQD